MDDGNGIRLEHRLTSLETKLGHIEDNIEEIKVSIKAHMDAEERLLSKIGDIKDELEDSIGKNATRSKIAMYSSGSTLAIIAAVLSILKFLG